MLIEIDTQQLKQLSLSPNQLCYIKSLLDKDHKKLKEFINAYQMNDLEFDDLINRNLIEYTDVKKLSVRVTQTFLDLYNTKDYFDEFYELYPIYVTRSDGRKDYLRTNMNRCRVAYNKIVNGSYEKHKKIIDYLNYQVAEMRKTNSICYMKRMPNWLASEEYLMYDEILNTVQQPVEPVYGTNIE